MKNSRSNIKEYAEYITKNMVEPSLIIVSHRPLFSISNAGLTEQLEYIEEEYARKANMCEVGFFSMAAMKMQITLILNEIANRN